MCRKDKHLELFLMLPPGEASKIVKQLVAEQATRDNTDKNAQAPGIPDQQEGRDDRDPSGEAHQISSPQSSASESLAASPQIPVNDIPAVSRVIYPVPSPGKDTSSTSVDAFLTFTLQLMFRHGEWMILCIYTEI